MTKRAKKLQDALSILAIEYLNKGNLDMASRINTVSNTLRADPKTLDRLAKILQKVG